MEKLLLKGKFVCFEKELYGLFLIYFDTEKNTESFLVAAGISSFISTYSIELPPEKIVDLIRDFINNEEASVEKSKEFEALFQSNIGIIKENLRFGSLKLTEIFMEILKNYLKTTVDVSITLEKTQDFNVVDVAEEKKQRDAQEKEQDMRIRYKIPSNTKVIDCFLVLSPIKGKLIKEVKEDDLVLVKIDDTKEEGKKIAELYQLYNANKKLKPIMGRVYNKFLENNEFVLTLYLSKDLVGFAREDASVKVSFIEPEKIISKKEIQNQQKKVEQRIEKKEEEKKEKMINEWMLYMGIGLFIVILIIVIGSLG